MRATLVAASLLIASAAFGQGAEDADFDGVMNATDRCPNELEDLDGNLDEDGCADLDDDADGVPDLVDRCPRVAARNETGCPSAGAQATTPIPPPPPGPPPVDEVAATPAAEAPAAPVVTDPIRKQKRFAVVGEIGWNGLAGFGPNFVFRPISRVAIDGGIGLSLVGFKLGARGRFVFLEHAFSPWVGAGLSIGTGTMGSASTYIAAGGPVTYEIGASPYLQFNGGVEFVASRGFTLIGYLGYAALLGQNVFIRSGGSRLTPVNRDELNALFGSGIQTGIALGLSF